jgi:hypothetical protein
MDTSLRKLVLKMSVTADGYVGGPEGEIDWVFKPPIGRRRKNELQHR